MKANKLSNKDIQIGDWLYITEHPMRKEAKQVKPEHFIRSLVTFEPIPITPEILEKNFELLYSKNGIYIYSGIKCRFIIQNHYDVKGWDWSLDYNKQTGTASAFGRVNYIHELQHCLRDNRIDKEIVV